MRRHKGTPIVETLAERLRLRHRLWYAAKSCKDEGHSFNDCMHPQHLPREAQAWRCCECWQRKLSNKWNAREFVRRHNICLPKLYWAGRDPADIPLDEIPDSYVLRATHGHSNKNVRVIRDNRDILHGTPFDRGQVREFVTEVIENGFTNTKVLLEEIIEDDQDRWQLPRDLKVFCFGGKVCAVKYGMGRGTSDHIFTFFDAQWRSLPYKAVKRRRYRAASFPPPTFLSQTLNAASRLGESYGSFVRIDFLHGKNGPVFGEFAPFPWGGSQFTDVANYEFGQMWNRYCPDAI